MNLSYCNLLILNFGVDLWSSVPLLKNNMFMLYVCPCLSEEHIKRMEKNWVSSPQLRAVTLIHSVWVIQPPHPSVLANVIFTLLSASPHLPTLYLLFFPLCFDLASFVYAMGSQTFSDQNPKEKFAKCSAQCNANAFQHLILHVHTILYVSFVLDVLSIWALHTSLANIQTITTTKKSSYF